MMQFPPPTPLTSSQNEKAIKLMDSLDRWSRRCDGHFNAKRTQPRNAFRQQVHVFVPDGFREFGERKVDYSFVAWARNLSAGGISILFPGELNFDRAIICLAPEQDQRRCVNATVIRRRRAAEEFWEYGLKFDNLTDDSAGETPDGGSAA